MLSLILGFLFLWFLGSLIFGGDTYYICAHHDEGHDEGYDEDDDHKKEEDDTPWWLTWPGLLFWISCIISIFSAYPTIGGVIFYGFIFIGALWSFIATLWSTEPLKE